MYICIYGTHKLQLHMIVSTCCMYLLLICLLTYIHRPMYVCIYLSVTHIYTYIITPPNVCMYVSICYSYIYIHAMHTPIYAHSQPTLELSHVQRVPRARICRNSDWDSPHSCVYVTLSLSLTLTDLYWNSDSDSSHACVCSSLSDMGLSHVCTNPSDWDYLRTQTTESFGLRPLNPSDSDYWNSESYYWNSDSKYWTRTETQAQTYNIYVCVRLLDLRIHVWIQGLHLLLVCMNLPWRLG
jgi:hypothetical protein